jgi:glycine cleavage system H protein
MDIPDNLKYTKTDEWIKIDGTIATLGITDYAQSQLSDVVFVEITVIPGAVVQKNSLCATIESVKAAAEVSLPIGGKVLEINEGLPNSPELVNSDPYGKAWMVKIELSNPAISSDLMDATAYQVYCHEREH